MFTSTRKRRTAPPSSSFSSTLESFVLSAEPNTDRRERTIKAHCFRFAFVHTGVHRTDEKISAIADTYLGVGEFQRSADKSSGIWNNKCSRTVEHLGGAIDGIIISLEVMTLSL